MKYVRPQRTRGQARREVQRRAYTQQRDSPSPEFWKRAQLSLRQLNMTSPDYP